MNARVRSPGSSAAETASAAVRRLAVGGLQAAERDVERQLLAVEVDAQRRDQLAEQPGPGAWLEIDFSARIFSSGSDSRCGR